VRHTKGGARPRRLALPNANETAREASTRGDVTERPLPEKDAEARHIQPPRSPGVAVRSRQPLIGWKPSKSTSESGSMGAGASGLLALAAPPPQERTVEPRQRRARRRYASRSTNEQQDDSHHTRTLVIQSVALAHLFVTTSVRDSRNAMRSRVRLGLMSRSRISRPVAERSRARLLRARATTSIRRPKTVCKAP
jgi:hypothetical protein